MHDFAYLRLCNNKGLVPDDLADKLTIQPDLARPGTEIHRISNDARLRGNIVQGFISRVDCNAPFNQSTPDFDIEYLMVSMVTQGGSWGSLAVNRGSDGLVSPATATN